MEALEAEPLARSAGSGIAQSVRSAASLSLPLIGFFFVQTAVGLATLALVGRLGTVSVGAIGIAGAILGAATALLNGFDTAVQALTARAIGADMRELAGRVLSEAHWLAIPLGLAISTGLFAESRALVGLLTSDEAVRAAGAAYLKGAAPALTFLAVTIPFNAYWIGAGVPKVAFLIQAIVSPLQLAAAWLLLFHAMPAFGLMGAGLAVSLACLLGLALQLWLGFRIRPIEGLHRHRPRATELGAIVAVSWPVSLQQCVLQSGLVIAFAIVSQIGVTAIALLNVLTTLMLVPSLISTGLAVACAPLVGQALGRNDPAQAKDWGWRMSLAGAALVFPFGLIALVVPRTLLAAFLTDPRTLEQAVFPAYLLGASVWIGAVAMILAFALRGAGATKVATGIPFLLQWMIRLPLMWLIAVRLHHGFNGIALVVLATTVVEALALAFVWQRGRWARLDPLGLHARTSTS